MIKPYVCIGNETLLSDQFGEVKLFKGQQVEMDEARAQQHIEAGAPIELLNPTIIAVPQKEHE